MDLVNIFLSYSRSDNSYYSGNIVGFAKRLEEACQTRGYGVKMTIDETTLAWGAEWKVEVNKRIDEASFMLVMLSPSYLLSKNCRYEILRFLENMSNGKYCTILPLVVSDPPWDKFNNKEIPELGKIREAIENHQWRVARVFDDTSNHEPEELKIAAAKAAESLIQYIDQTHADSSRPKFDLLVATLDELYKKLDKIMPQIAKGRSHTKNSLSGTEMTQHLNSLRIECDINKLKIQWVALRTRLADSPPRKVDSAELAALKEVLMKLQKGCWSNYLIRLTNVANTDKLIANAVSPLVSCVSTLNEIEFQTLELFEKLNNSQEAVVI